MYDELWEKLRCNYGYRNAAHVPEAVKRLFESRLTLNRKKAYWKLDNYIITQGYLDDSAPYTLDLMHWYWVHRFPKIPHEVLDLLYELAGGFSDYDIGIGLYTDQSVMEATRQRFCQFVPDIRLLAQMGNRKTHTLAAEIIEFYDSPTNG